MTPEKKFQIFISSTYTDLIKAREEVIKVILNLYHIPIGMEMFSAGNDEQWTVIESTIKTSDYYLLIIGHRYGSLTKENISYTEREFDHAKALGIPILAFVRNQKIATTPEERDSDVAKIKMLESFISKVKDNAMCDFWSNPEELGQKVAIALPKTFSQSPRTGWIRGDNGISAEAALELIKLSQQNRELRNDLDNLKSQLIVRKPIIDVTLNQKALTLEWKKGGEFFEYMKISDSLITDDLLAVSTQEEITNFNTIVEEKDREIFEYKKKYTEYVNIKNSRKELTLKICNNGDIKASDIYIDVVFPPEIKLFEKDEKFSVPKKPDIPEHPFNKMLKSSFAHLYNPFVTNFNSISVPDMKFPKLYNPNRVVRINSEDNSLFIKLASLIHTRVSLIKEDIFIAPLYKGTFEIDVTVICEQYTKAESFKIPITVKQPLKI